MQMEFLSSEVINMTTLAAGKQAKIIQVYYCQWNKKMK